MKKKNFKFTCNILLYKIITDEHFGIIKTDLKSKILLFHNQKGKIVQAYRGLYNNNVRKLKG